VERIWKMKILFLEPGHRCSGYAMNGLLSDFQFLKIFISQPIVIKLRISMFSTVVPCQDF